MITRPEHIKTLYMLGIGGIGMSALARYFNERGVSVSGYDRNASPLTEQLIREGIDIHFDDDPEKIPLSTDLVIYTPAIPSDLKEFVYVSATNIPVKKRAEVLGDLSRHANTIAVSGTHGKTTVSTMIAHLLHTSKLGCTAFLGGISKNYQSNFIHSESGKYMVVEADEYDKSFLQLQPRFSVVTSMDADHLDIYSDYHNLKNTFRSFIDCTQVGGNILIKEGIDLGLLPEGRKLQRYALDQSSDFHAANIRLENHQYVFDLVTPDKILKGLTLRMPGLINIENAVAAASVAFRCGVEEEEIRHALSCFEGIHRRFDVRVWEEDCIYIDDYAHHPEEILALIQSVRKLFPGKSILGIFQPHLFSRTRDFAEGFAASLSLLDEVVVLPIYPAREKPMHGVDTTLVLDKIDLRQKTMLEKEALLRFPGLRDHDIVLTIGAGDIDRLVAPLEEVLKTTLKTKR